MLLVNEKTEQVNPIKGFIKCLFPYQLSTIYAMEILENGTYEFENKNDYGNSSIIKINTTFGILSNQVGTGKTITILGLCKRNTYKIDASVIMTKNFMNPLSTYNGFDYNIETRNYDYSSLDYTNASLIVVPTTIIKQWENELLTTDISFIIIKTNKNVENIDIEILKSIDVVLCSNTFYNKLITKFNNFTWNRLIIDESDSIKQLNCIIKYNFMWMITSTSGKLLESNLINNLHIYQQSKYVNIRCTEEYIYKYMEQSVINKFIIECYTPIYIDVLNGNISREFQNIINADDMETAISRLGGNIKQDTDLILLFKNKINNKISSCNNDIEFLKHSSSMDQLCKTLKILKISKEIESLHTKLNSIEDRINKRNENICCICMDNFVNPVISNCCDNIFCFECILKALKIKKNCIICREQMTIEDLTVITSISDKQRINTLSKQQHCINILLNNPHGKFLIFSDYSFNKIKNSLTTENINFKELKGSSDIVSRVIKNYKENDLNVLLLNITYKGAGINLENTTDIIIYHTVDTDLEKQIIGRAMRLGRQKDLPLNIHYLKYNNE